MVRIGGASGAITQQERQRSRNLRPFRHGFNTNGIRLDRDQQKKALQELQNLNNDELNELNLAEIERQIQKLDDEDSEDSSGSNEEEAEERLGKKQKYAKNTPSAKSAKNKKKLFALPGVDMKFDNDDHELTYARKCIDRDPQWFEEHGATYFCFQSLNIFAPFADFSKINKGLMQYVNEFLASWEPQKLGSIPEIITKDFRTTKKYTNVCISPLQAMRAWGLLANVAAKKTRKDMLAFVAKYTTTKHAYATVEDLNQELLNLHVASEDDFDGCVRLFTELPHHLAHKGQFMRDLNGIYGGKSSRAALQHHCFATDPDGFYSCYRINEENWLSTNGQIRYVIPETHAPNWRASMVLTSANDCVFYWKTDEIASDTDSMRFWDSSKHETFSLCTGMYALATVRVSPKNDVFELPSWVQGCKLYLIKNQDARKFDPKIVTTVSERLGWKSKTVKIMLPKSTTSTPISLFKHAKENGLSRVFNSEKSQLDELRDKSVKYNFITLYDHYHKTNFEISAVEPVEPNQRDDFDNLEPAKAHQLAEGQVFGNGPRDLENNDKFYFTYYEDHLDQNPNGMIEPPDEKEYIAPEPEDLAFDEPFHYVMVRSVKDRQIILCAGYFCNTIWVNNDK